MRKKLLALTLTLGLFIGVVQPVTAYAADDEKTTQAIAAAEEKTFNTDYSVTWSDEVQECWSKITLNEQGFIKVDMSKPENKTLGDIDLNLNIYDENEEFSPQYDYVKGKTTNYKFTFTPDKYCEIEKNNTRDTATDMKTDHAYTGIMGSNAGSFSKNKDDADVYAITLKKGQLYKYVFNKEKGTTIAKLYGTKVSFGTLWTSYAKENFCVSPDDVFIAPYSGVYYAYVYNYLGDQYQYKISVNNVTPKKPTLNSIKAGNKIATVNWTKTKGMGYQVQYSLNKDFKNAKAIDVSSTKTTAKIKKLSSNKKYYVRVRSYTKYNSEKAKDNYKYSSWSNVKTVKVK